MDLSYEYEDYGYEDEEDQDDHTIMKENLFTEAEDNRAADPSLALEQFRSLLLMDQEDQTYRFECTFNIL